MTPPAALRLYACYEAEPYDGPLSPFRRLSGAMSSEDHRRYLFAQAAYGQGSIETQDLREAVGSLLDRPQAILSGGLVATKADFRLWPGCCSGIESWRKWRSVRKGEGSPWLGHDPDPGVDTSGERAILYDDLPFSTAKRAEVSYDEIQAALDDTEQDLRDFLKGLEAWLMAEGVEEAADLCAKIDDWYAITAPD